MKKIFNLLALTLLCILANAQAPAIVKGYVGGECMSVERMVDVSFGDTNDVFTLTVFEDGKQYTSNFSIAKEKTVLFNDTLVRTKYIFKENGFTVCEPCYEDGIYTCDYCKVVLYNLDVFDKLVILLFL